MRTYLGGFPFLLAILVLIGATGCSRTKYRLQADQDAYSAIAERNSDPRWHSLQHSIELDPRSRYFDSYDVDCPPMPADDPASHQYMQIVDGKKGWKHWYDNGFRDELENPNWRVALADYVETTEGDTVKLNVESALRLAYIHSPLHQRQLETLYLSALDVTAERFRLDSQFFGGYDAVYNHNGSLVPARLSFDPTAGKFVVAPPFDADGLENNRLTVGRPSAGNPALQLQRRFATAGQLLVGFANSFVFEFTGGDANLAASLANFSFIQPLLRGAGKDVALEELTFEERKLLANLRAYGQFRQGFFTEVAIGERGVVGPQRGGFGTGLQSFSGLGGVGGYLGLLQQLQEYRNSSDNLRLQLRTRLRLESLYDNELIDLVQVDQFRQSVEAQRAEVLRRQNNLELALDRYKTGTLGLPADLSIELEQKLIEPFQLIPQETAPLLASIFELQRRLAAMPDEPELNELQSTLDNCFDLADSVEQLFETAQMDLERLDAIVPIRERSMNEEERQLFRRDREQLYKKLRELRSGSRGLDAAFVRLRNLNTGLRSETRSETLLGVRGWAQVFLQIVERLSLVPAQARLELITVEPIEISSADAFQSALANRLDFMNGRAALVDRWRVIQVNADALQSVLNVTADGDIRTARDNAVSFRAPTGSLRMGVEFDAPFTRLLERNAYRESLIEYQRSRRELIQSRDALQLGLRALLRSLEQQRKNLEIQRRAVAIAMRRVDQTQLELTQPRPPAQPGVRPFINPTTAINLLGAQGALQNTQNAFLAAWLNYYATRMRLYREMGIMRLDIDGQWIEHPINDEINVHSPGNTEAPGQPPETLPPIPAQSMETSDHRPDKQHVRPREIATHTHDSFRGEMTRLPDLEVALPRGN